ncbi:hypothetical protein BDW62DRAFT_164058 [Aspergillus aurantiobrunneus]
MIPSLLRAPLRFRRIPVPTAPVLYCRSPACQPVNNERPFTPSRRFKQTQSGGPPTYLGKHKITARIDGEYMKLSYIRLRDYCKCPLCVDMHSKQRNFRISDIPPDIKVKSFKWDGDILEVAWENDVPGFDSSHVSRYHSIHQLKYPLQTQSDSSPTGRLRSRDLWGKKHMEDAQHWISYEDYMNNDAKFISAMHSLAKLGLIFLKDIPDSREMVEKIATRIGPLRNTFYGPTWDVRQVPQAKNVAYTSQFLGFHMDLLYMNEPPAFQLLHCIRNSCDGGESLFTDAFHVANHMRRFEQTNFNTLKTTNLRYEYLHKENSYNMIRPVFEEGFSAGRRGLQLAYVNYSPPFHGPQSTEDGTSSESYTRQCREIRALKSFADHLESDENMFQLKLKPGECVIFENRRVVHARRQFDTSSGERWLAGAYLDDDVVRSRFKVSGLGSGSC